MRTSALLAAIGAICVPMLSADLAQAQATRTWVSGVGDDANPCSRTAPCKTFAGAISKTATGGIIMCMDSAGFGALTITKSLTVDCGGYLGGVLATGGINGINVVGAGIVVHLRNLSIEGAGTGSIGVRINQAATVHIDNCFIYGFRGGSAAGIKVDSTTATEVRISNTTVADNGTGTTAGGGVVVQPTTATGSALVSLDNVRLSNNSVGLAAIGTGSTATTGVRVTLRKSVVTGNAGRGVSAQSAVGAATTDLMLSQVSVTHNGGGAIEAVSGQAVMTVGDSVITHNLGAPAITLTSGGLIFSYQNNQVQNNPGGAGAFSGPANHL